MKQLMKQRITKIFCNILPKFIYTFNLTIVDISFDDTLFHKLESLGATILSSSPRQVQFKIPEYRLSHTSRLTSGITRVEMTNIERGNCEIKIDFVASRYLFYSIYGIMSGLVILISTVFLVPLVTSVNGMFIPLLLLLLIWLAIFCILGVLGVVSGHLFFLAGMVENARKIRKFFMEIGE